MEREDPILGAMHKNVMQDFATNLQLEMIAHMLGESKVTLGDLPDMAQIRQILSKTMKRMKDEHYRVMIKNDMIVFYDTGNDAPAYQRNVAPGVLLTQGEIDSARPSVIVGDETPTLGNA